MTDRQKTSFGIWFAAGLILLLVVYPLSVGPLAYVVTSVGEQNVPPWCLNGLSVIYYPVLWAINEGPEWLSRPGSAYMEWWMQPQDA